MLTAKMSPLTNHDEQFVSQQQQQQQQSPHRRHQQQASQLGDKISPPAISRSITLPPLSDLLKREENIPHPISPPTRMNSMPNVIDHSKLQTPVRSNSQKLSPREQAAVIGSSSAERKSYAFISHSPATFPSHEPAIDNAQLARRKRRRTSPNELTILQREFELGHTPNRARRQEIASKVNMTEKAVQIWFQNKRQALRKAQMNDHSIHQTTTITLPEIQPLSGNDATSPIRATPTKFYDNPNNSDAPSMSTSPISATSNSSSMELPLAAPNAADSQTLALAATTSPLHNRQEPLAPPKPATWTMMQTPLKFAPVTPIRHNSATTTTSGSASHTQQLPTPSLMSFKLNKPAEEQKSMLPTPVSSISKYHYQHQAPLQRPPLPLHPTAQLITPSPAESKVKSIMSLSNLNSPALETASVATPAPVQKKRNALGDITNTSYSKGITKKEGEYECVEHLLSLRGSNWK